MGMWNKSNLKNPIKCLEYRRTLYTKLSKQTQQQEVEQEWEQIWMAITEAANEVIQKQDKKQRSEWWDKDCQLAIKRKNDTQRRWLLHKTRASSEWYHKKRNEANRMCALKKKEWINETIRQIEENHKKNGSRKFFSEIQNLKQQNIRFPFMCKDENNIVITQTNQILNRWKDYFRAILNLDSNHRIQPITSDNQTEVVIQPLSYIEVCLIINKLKSNKAGGTDNIIPELVKQGGRTLKQRLYKLILMIWEKEQLPNQWKEGIICPMYKKGDRLDCTNCRPITLLKVAYKIFAIILNQRLVDIIETELGDCQTGFRPNRSTVDNIFMIRQITEKCYEYNSDIRNIFIDYTHALDTIKRNKILDSLIQYKIPPPKINKAS